ncbi:MAG TPA: hypothetical protein VEZ90_13860 [Blastocatellia bacterium]|nr:hypothetical protein [Blastocatellia bacterium]
MFKGRIRSVVILSISLAFSSFSAFSHSHQESQDSKSEASGVTKEEYSIYASLIKQLYIKPNIKLIVTREHTFRYDSSRGEDDQPWKGKVKGIVIDPTASQDFEAKNEKHWLLDQASLNLGVKAEISTDADLRAIFHGKNGDLEWIEYYKRYPDAGGILSFSRVGFNSAHTQGLVYIGIHCGPDCGDCHFFLLEKSGDAWTIKKVLRKISWG